MSITGLDSSPTAMARRGRAAPLRWALLVSTAYGLGCEIPAGAGSQNGGMTLNSPGVFGGCPDAGADAASDAGNAGDAGDAAVGPCVPTAPRTFSTEVKPIFGACSGEVCHKFDAAGLSAAIGKPSTECCDGRSLIVPGSPEHSYILNKLLGQNLCGGGRMPLDKPALSAASIQVISDWICEGAPLAP